MKKLLLFIIALSVLGWSIYLSCITFYIGDVVGKVKVSEKYTPQNRNYECVDISFTYKTPKGKIYDKIIDRVDPYYLNNTNTGRRLANEHKYYDTPDWLCFCLILGICGSIALFIILLIGWICYAEDPRYNCKTQKEKFYCEDCSIRSICYFENTRIHLSETSKLNLKQFFGY